uniref:Uncharacterized protein n=1 Tax=Rhizophora mucronata TaxID=61149 RepID=A0A2P2IKI2_RHIMU
MLSAIYGYTTFCFFDSFHILSQSGLFSNTNQRKRKKMLRVPSNAMLTEEALEKQLSYIGIRNTNCKHYILSL